MVSFPKNETFEHFVLKNIGSLYLKHNQLCNFVAEEFVVRDNLFLNLAKKQFDWNIEHKYNKRSITDVLGFKTTISTGKTTIKNIEAKYSYKDFKKGFCIAGEYNYVIAPKDVIPAEELPPFVGLIEINFDNFYYTGYKIKGYKTKKRAKKIKISKKEKKNILEVMKWRMLYKLSEEKFADHWLKKVRLKRKYGDKFGVGVKR